MSQDNAWPAATLVTRVLGEPATIVHRIRSHRVVHRRRLAAAVAGLAVAIGLAGGGVYAVAGDDPSGVSAPDVVGGRVAAARAEVAKRAHEDALKAPKVKVVDRSYSESAPAGAIVAQDPPEGKRIPENGALLVSVSKGSAYADVPSVAGLEGAAAFTLLRRNGFTPSRRYAPSAEIEGWHAVETDPAAGTRVKRPAHVQLVVSTGPPKRLVPSVDGLDAGAAVEALQRAGFSPVVEERPNAQVEPGTLLRVSTLHRLAGGDRVDDHGRRRARAALGGGLTGRGHGGRRARADHGARRGTSRALDHGHVPARALGRHCSGRPVRGHGGISRMSTPARRWCSRTRRTGSGRSPSRSTSPARRTGRWPSRCPASDGEARRASYASAVARTPPERRALRRSTAFVWSCETRDSVTPSTSPISRRVSSS